MPGDPVTMSARELERLALMQRIAERRTTQRMVAEQLGLTVRQVERLYAAYKARGAAALVSRRRGARSGSSSRSVSRFVASDSASRACWRRWISANTVMRRARGEPGLPTRRAPGRPTIREQVLACVTRSDGTRNGVGVVDQLVA